MSGYPQLREQMKFTNVVAMTPFRRTVGEVEEVLRVLADNGLQVHLIFETPSNVVLAEQFLAHLCVLDRVERSHAADTGFYCNSDELAGLFDEQDKAVTTLIAQVIRIARRVGCKVGICGKAQSDHSELSVISGRFVEVKRQVVASEHRQNWKRLDGSGDNKWNR